MDFVLSNCTWANGVLTPEFRQPFDMLTVEVAACAEEKAAGVAPPTFFKIGSPSRTRTYDPAVNSRLLYRLSYRGVATAYLSSPYPGRQGVAYGGTVLNDLARFWESRFAVWHCLETAGLAFPAWNDARAGSFPSSGTRAHSGRLTEHYWPAQTEFTGATGSLSARVLSTGGTSRQWHPTGKLEMDRPLAVLFCPTRPAADLLPANPIVVPFDANWMPQVAKTHYAVNEGDYITNTLQGPNSLQQGDSGAYPWVDTTLASGIAYQRSQVTPAMVTDGLSCTYMLGEKYVSVPGYFTHSDPGYDQSACSGVDLDLNRWVLAPPLADAAGINQRLLGSAHAAGCHMAFCDGAVRLISYQIDAEVHRRLGNRQDGQPVDGSQY